MELGEWVIEEACRAAAAWPEPITVALNISAQAARSCRRCPTSSARRSPATRLQANRLELEVTEGVFLGDNGDALDVLEAPARARRRHRARRFRHRLFVDRLSEQGGLPQAEDRRQLRPRGRHATARMSRSSSRSSSSPRASACRSPPRASRPPTISSACATSAATPDPGLSVRPPAELRARQRDGPRHPAAGSAPDGVTAALSPP